MAAISEGRRCWLGLTYVVSACSFDCLRKYKEDEIITLITTHLPCARGSGGLYGDKVCSLTLSRGPLREKWGVDEESEGQQGWWPPV